MTLSKNLLFISVILLFLTTCKKDVSLKNKELQKTETELKTVKERQEAILDEHLKNGAWKYSYTSKEWQSEIDKGLAKDSTIAYLWQQKAMPLFKKRKYELGMEYLDKAVLYEPQNWLAYRAFMKCIFVKSYREAIIDFENCKEKYGDSYVMDHTYNFHIALSYLQLNEFKKAEDIFKKDYEKQLLEHGKDWLHPVDLFYYGISKYEQEKYQEAIELFDLALEIHTQFSDVQYYKAMSLFQIGKVDQGKELMEIAEINGKQGLSFNEDNAIYETYPYQVRWN